MKNKDKIKQPWPTKDAMEQIYELNLWGSGEGEFYSGEGSHQSEIIKPYIKEVSGYLKSFEKPLTIVDLGCGDFNIGKQLVKYSKQYNAIDIVSDLIEYNKIHFKIDNLEFMCQDIALDELPDADCVIIRQVLQHLSNKEIQQIVNKLSNYKYIILTEHLPDGEYESNKDIISGQGIRLKKQSGVVLTDFPFSFKPKSEKKILSVKSSNFKGEIVTIIYELN